MLLEQLTRKLHERCELNAAEAREAALALASPEIAEATKIDFLAALAAKGETADEIAAFAQTYRGVARDPGVQEWAPRALDIVGTGGDHAGGFNVSTLVTLTLAAAGVPVMKHGNAGITSKCGSADLMAAFGLDLQATPEKTRAALRALGYCFFFAPAYHPTFKHIAPARKALAARGQRTIFNILGPLINPGRPANVMLGVYSPALVAKFATTLETLGCPAGIVAHGVIADGRGIDEWTTATDNLVAGVGRVKGATANWTPADFGMARAAFPDLVGGDVATNVALAEAILAGRAPRGLSDTIVAVAAMGLWVTGREPTVASGVPRVRELLFGGAVAKKIADTREFYRS
ncbi:MAG: anthranilate phosphoribosyltransferase [Opitutae bacterium]|nr:anthranilate phosphoribosyltransferase [Opitutae bacterium]